MGTNPFASLIETTDSEEESEIPQNNVNQGPGVSKVNKKTSNSPELKAETKNLPVIQFRRVNMTQSEPVSFLTLNIKIAENEVEALLDTGARISLIKKSVVDMLNLQIDKNDKTKIYGIGGKDQHVITLGSVKVDMGISTLMFYNTNFHVVPDSCMDHFMFIGMDFLHFNGLSVNVCRKRIKHYDHKTGAQWELYLLPEGYKLVLSNILCKAATRINFNGKTDSLVKIPVKIMYPSSVMKVAKDPNMYLYDGEIDGKLGRHAMGVSGIINMSDPFVFLTSNDPGARSVKIGDNLGRVSTVIPINDSESLPVNLAQPKEFNLNEGPIKLDLGEQLTTDQIDGVYKLLMEHRSVISMGEDDVGRIDVGSLEIKLYDHTPIYHRPRRFPDPLAGEVDKECEKLRAQDIIEPSHSSYNCRILPIRKPDGSLRLCMDYRELNSKTIPDRFPMTNLLDSVYSLHGFKYFTTIDLVRGYYQMEVDEDSRQYTAFSTSRGHWQYKRMPFGLKNAPAAFQRAMQTILSAFPRNRVIVYLDDILIIEKDFEKHKILVKQVLNTLISHGIKIKLEKCSWFKDKVEFLGHEVSTTGVKKHPSYIKKVNEFPKPETVKELQEFMGLVNWQRKFVPKCAMIGKSLYAQTGGKPKSKITWTPEMLTAFQRLKEILIDDVELAFPDYSKDAPPLQLYVDASATGAGACLCQMQNGDLRVIVYDSHSFSETQQKYSTIERELAAIRWGVKSCKPFLLGQKFKLFTDHQPLVYLHNMKLVDHRLARTLEDLAEYNFEIVYQPGHLNQAADMLSRVRLSTPEEVELPSKFIPDGIGRLIAVPGGGDSMFESLIKAYNEFKIAKKRQDNMTLTSETTLRTELVTDLINNPKRFGLPTDAKFKKQLRSMLQPGVLPIPEVLVAFAERYKVIVCVHYGYKQPVIFQGFADPGDSRVHLECLAGVHYNPLVEYPSYDVKFIKEWGTTSNYYTMFEQVSPIKTSNCNTITVVDENNEELEQVLPYDLPCNHRFDGATAVFDLPVGPCCALLDSGALVNLMTEDLFYKLNNVVLDKSGLNLIRGIGDTGTQVHGTIVQPLACKELNIPAINLKFLVVPNHVLDTCVLLGIPCLNKLDIDLDFKCLKVRHDQFNMNMGINIYPEADQIEYENSISMATFYISDYNIPGISLDKILIDQGNCVKVRQIRDLISDNTPVAGVPKKFVRFKRHWSHLNIQNGLLVKSIGEKGIPVVSFNLLVDIVLKVHIQNAHIGAFKLYELLSEHIWQPSLRSVIRDACNTCSICQKNKTISRVKVPPTIKIKTKAPFELVAMDLVSLPTTPDGYVGILVLVDHHTKWLAVSPIKNKRTKTIIDKLENQLFPGLVKVPSKILTDNGPEFNSLEFSDMAERLNIHHLKTTAYKPSSNGAVERVNRTVIEFLRSLTGGPAVWKDYLPIAVRTYNNTTHNETKISPAQFIMTREHDHSDIPIISKKQRELWEEGHPQYSAYKPGQSVLRRIFRKGRQNVDKFKPKYSGPYTVEVAHDNKVTYILKDPDDGQTFKAHHCQLKPWRNPPMYIIRHLSRFPINMEKLEGEEVCPIIQEEYNPVIPIVPVVPDFRDSESENEDDKSSSDENLPLGFPEYHPSTPDNIPVIENVVPELPTTPNLDSEIEENQCRIPNTPLSTIVEVSESSENTNNFTNKNSSSESEKSDSIDLESIIDQGIGISNDISETGIVMHRNVLDWDYSSITSAESLSSASYMGQSNEQACENCDSLLSLIEELEQLCLQSKSIVNQETAYQALSLVPVETLGAGENFDNSSFPNNNLSPLVRTKSLPNLADFSGFEPKDTLYTRTGPENLAERLRDIARGLADARDTVLQRRKDSLDRVRETIEGGRTRMESVRIALDFNSSSPDRSPPFLRSRGRAQELELVPARPVEYKIYTKKKK